MQRKKRLIGRYDMLAGGNGFKHQTLGWLNAAHYFHDDVDFRIIDQIVPVFRERHSFVNDAASAINIATNHGLDFNGSTGSARKFLCVTLKNGIRAAPYGSESGDADFDCFHCFFPFVLQLFGRFRLAEDKNECAFCDCIDLLRRAPRRYCVAEKKLCGAFQ